MCALLLWQNLIFDWKRPESKTQAHNTNEEHIPRVASGQSTHTETDIASPVIDTQAVIGRSRRAYEARVDYFPIERTTSVEIVNWMRKRVCVLTLFGILLQNLWILYEKPNHIKCDYSSSSRQTQNAPRTSESFALTLSCHGHLKLMHAFHLWFFEPNLRRKLFRKHSPYQGSRKWRERRSRKCSENWT